MIKISIFSFSLSFQVLLGSGYEFILNGKVALEKGRLAATFCDWGPQYFLEFDIEINKVKLDWLNVLHMTIGRP